MELLAILAIIVVGLGGYAFSRVRRGSESKDFGSQPYDPGTVVNAKPKQSVPGKWHKGEFEPEVPKSKPKKKKATKKKAKKKAKKKSSGRKSGGRKPNMTIADKE